MRIHGNSHVPGMENFTGVKALQHYADSIVRYRLDDNSLLFAEQEIAKFNIEGISDDILKEFYTNETFDLDFLQFALIITLLRFENRKLSMGLIKAYALRLNIKLSAIGFQKILDTLTNKGILIAQNVGGVIKYILQRDILNSVYTTES